MSKILVSGATGFIGRRLARRLVEVHGADAITCLTYRDVHCDTERSGRQMLAELGVRSLPVDLVTAAGLENVPRQPDLIFHLASQIDTGARDHRVDDAGTRHLFDAIGPLAPGRRVVFTSSIAVMDHRQRHDEPPNEQSVVLRPHSEYGRRKLLAEEYLRARASEQGFSLAITRACAVYGNGIRHDGIFGRIGDMVRRDSFLARLDYPGTINVIYVDDMVEILLRLADEPMTAGECRVVLPAAEVLTLAAMIAASCKRFGKAHRPIHMSPSFWRFCDRVAHHLFRLHPVLPHVLSNKLWQLRLTVTNTLLVDPATTRARYPDLRFRRFDDSLSEIW